jgi:RecJ-like exonuclease
MTITISIAGDDEEIEHELPSKNEVCSECSGEGYVLCEGMRGHAYSAEEFNEAFYDDEDKAEYFRRGGKYDVTCHVCKGKNVVPVVDENQLTKEQKEIYKVYLEQEESRQEDEANYRAECRMERVMGC